MREGGPYDEARFSKSNAFLSYSIGGARPTRSTLQCSEEEGKSGQETCDFAFSPDRLNGDCVGVIFVMIKKMIDL